VDADSSRVDLDVPYIYGDRDLGMRGRKIPVNMASASFPFAVFMKKVFGLPFTVVFILKVDVKLR
jgi:hypothetical protein